jgi:hypothetical protein
MTASVEIAPSQLQRMILILGYEMRNPHVSTNWLNLAFTKAAEIALFDAELSLHRPLCLGTNHAKRATLDSVWLDLIRFLLLENPPHG